MTVVAEILKSKPDPTVHTVRPEDSVLDALRLMAEKGIGALLGRTSAATQVRDVMTTDVLYVRLHQTSEQCMQLMSTNRLRHLPVVENDKLVGMISIGDLVKDIISEQKFIIEQLEQYINGGR